MVQSKLSYMDIKVNTKQHLINKGSKSYVQGMLLYPVYCYLLFNQLYMTQFQLCSQKDRHGCFARCRRGKFLLLLSMETLYLLV